MRSVKSYSHWLMGWLTVLVALWAMALPARAELSLVMVQQPGCHWCAQWNDQIAPIYPKTPEGARAPLRRIELREPVPDDLSLKSAAVFTPTFILVDDGQEIGRMEGYPGEDMFWWMLARMFSDSGISLDDSPK